MFRETKYAHRKASFKPEAQRRPDWLKIVSLVKWTNEVNNAMMDDVRVHDL